MPIKKETIYDFEVFFVFGFWRVKATEKEGPRN